MAGVGGWGIPGGGVSLLWPPPCSAGRQEVGGPSQALFPWTTSSRRLKGLGLHHSGLSPHQGRSSFLFAGMGSCCYTDSRRYPSRWLIPGLPLSVQRLLQQLGWQNHLVCDQRDRRQALPRDLGKAPLISPRPGTFQTRDTRSPGGRRGKPEGVGTDTPWEWQERFKTCQERGLRLQTGRRGQ